MKDSTYITKKPAFYKRKAFLSTLVGLFFISIMVFSVLEIGLSNSQEKKVKVEGLSFVQTNSGWQAYTDDEKKIVLQVNPETLEDISSPSFSAFMPTEKVYVSVNPYDDVQGALYDFKVNLVFSVPVVQACTQDNALCGSYPIKTCVDATSAIGVVVFQEGNTSVITLENNCLTIQGKDLLSVTDKFILDQYGSTG